MRRAWRYVGTHHLALIALFFALCGTSFAAGSRLLPPNSVGTKQLKRNAVTSPKVKNNSLRGIDVLESTFGEVPLARHAARADTAATADTATHARASDAAAHASTASNATRASAADSAAHASTADSATNATELGGVAAENYVRSFGGGAATGGEGAFAGGDPFHANAGASTSLNVGVTGMVIGTILMTCDDPAQQYVSFRNDRSDTEQVWYEGAGAAAAHVAVGPSATTTPLSNGHVTFFIAYHNSAMARVDVFTYVDVGTNTCNGYVFEAILPFTP